MKKTFKVVMLPTKKASPIQYVDEDKHLYKYPNDIDNPNDLIDNLGFNQHLCIISDDEIKEGDWMTNGKDIYQAPNADGFIGLYKIIAATDKLLVNNGFPNPKDSKEPITVSLIPESFISDYIKAYNEGRPITEVELEIEYNEVN